MLCKLCVLQLHRRVSESLFDEFDNSGTGSVEYVSMLSKLASDGSGVRSVFGNKTYSDMVSFDLRRVHQTEDAAQIKWKLGKERTRLLKLLHEWDDDARGLVSRVDFWRVLTLLGLLVSVRGSDAVFDTFATVRPPTTSATPSVLLSTALSAVARLAVRLARLHSSRPTLRPRSPTALPCRYATFPTTNFPAQAGEDLVKISSLEHMLRMQSSPLPLMSPAPAKGFAPPNPKRFGSFADDLAEESSMAFQPVVSWKQYLKACQALAIRGGARRACNMWGEMHERHFILLLLGTVAREVQVP